MELWHAMNRGVDKRQIFYDDHDRARFVHDLFEFNDINAAREYKRRNVGRPTSHIREKIVDIHGWCIMPNHYHLLVSARAEHGISLFLKKLNGGYAKFFNEKYERSGTLFQSRTKKILIERDAHFLYILHYIHLNALDLHKETALWREGDLANTRKALQMLEAYKWSSFRDYCGVKNFSSVLHKDLFAGVFKEYRRAIGEYLKDVAATPQELLLE